MAAGGDMDIARTFLCNLPNCSYKVRNVSHVSVDEAVMPLRQRLAFLLINHASTTKRPGVSQSEMADMLDVSRETLSSTLMSLQTEGAICINRNRIAINKSALERISIETTEARPYILLKTRDGNLEQARDIARRHPGIVTLDRIEGPADLIIMMQAPDRESLAQLTVSIIAAMEEFTEDIQILPIRE